VEDQEVLLEILTRAQAAGFLGPGDPANHLTHALGFVDAALSFLPAPPRRFADLGTGGGVPGLVLASLWDDSHAVFIESAARRCQALEEWAAELGISDRVEVVSGRAEQRAHEVGLRETFDLVTARSFARPAVTAEIACGFLKVGAPLVVSEPPEPPADRWPPAALEALGFGPIEEMVVRGAHYAGARKFRAADADVPRPVGRPAKRPRW
jgi:16S rRNA (guanine527-N7)-methyltransferase